MAGKSLPDQVKASTRNKPPVEEKTLELVSTGSTLLNLACSDTWAGGFGEGKMINIIGDSSAGKTLLALTVLAELTQDERFKDYRLIFDDVEAALEFNLDYLFGSSIDKRLESPCQTKEGDEDTSHTIEDFQNNIDAAIKKGKPFIYILDSLDALTSEEDIKKKAEKQKKGGKAKGSYGMGKPKKMSQIMREICRDVKKADSFLIVISQVRDNPDPMAFVKKRRSGGNALRFYCTHEIWLIMKQKITKKRKTESNKKKDRILGAEVTAKISKNKITGKVREIDFNIYYDYGIDDIGSCIDFLVNEEHWKVEKQTIHAVEFNFNGTRASLIKHVEENGREKKLARVTGKVWNRIEDSLRLGRKGKYQ